MKCINFIQFQPTVPSFFLAQTGDPYKFSYKFALQILWKFPLYASRKYLQFSLRVSARVESTYQYAQFQLEHSPFLSNQLSLEINLNLIELYLASTIERINTHVNKARYTAQDAPSTRLKTRDRRTDRRTDGRTDGHDLL